MNVVYRISPRASAGPRGFPDHLTGIHLRGRRLMSELQNTNYILRNGSTGAFFVIRNSQLEPSRADSTPTNYTRNDERRGTFSRRT